jgi:ribosomal protein S18 acetylase RimI-like enzyme
MITTLSNVALEEIHDAFIDAFSEYEVKLDMPIEKLNEMMITRSYSKDDSIGYFKDNKLIGFILIGLREINNKKVYYDVATGVRKGNQGEGIGDALLKEIPKIMNDNKIDRFSLEVLENNIAAQNLYKKYGFVVTRRLKCYEYMISKEKRKRIEIKEENISVVSNLSIKSYCTFDPSWQNSLTSYLNSKENYSIFYLENEHKLEGYGIVHKKNGSVLQIGLDPEKRTTSVLSKIVEGLCKNTDSTNLKYLNVEDGSEVENLLVSIGFSNFINQYEMEYKIEREST